MYHLTSGNVHPESSAISGLPAAYIIRQMVAFKNGERTGGRAPVMIAMAKVLTDADVKAAAEYYAALKPRIGYNKVIETETVAKSYVGPGGMRFATGQAAPNLSAIGSSCCPMIPFGRSSAILSLASSIMYRSVASKRVRD
jgi:hypothetical protein